MYPLFHKLSAHKLLLISLIGPGFILVLSILGFILKPTAEKTSVKTPTPPTLTSHKVIQYYQTVEKKDKREIITKVKCEPSTYQPVGNEKILTDDAGNQTFPRHLLGTDNQGRDLLARNILSARVYFIGSIIAFIVSVLFGVPFGIIASGFWSNRRLAKAFQHFILSLIDVLESMPKYITILLLITFILYTGPFYQIVRFSYIALLVGMLNAAKIGRLTQNQIHFLEKREFIEATQALGIRNHWIALKHILAYNYIPLFVTQFSLQIAEIIILEITVAFIGKHSPFGLGVTFSDFDYPSWGNILTAGGDGYWIIISPIAFALLVILLCYSLAHWVNTSYYRERTSIEEI
jgi:ABC-type dipeptide/oligopeptide/nickel transport system permease subunit